MATVLRGSDNLDSAKVLSEELAGSIVADSAGRVTMPYQPSFNVYGGTAAVASDVSFASVRHNTGNHWNTSTNTFTAPVAGTYHFSFAFLHNTSSALYCRVLFKINGTADTRYGDTLQSNPSGTFNASSASVTIYLNANDTVKLYNEQSALYEAPYGAFSGFLIG